MTNSKFFNVARVSRALMGGAALVIAMATTAFAPSAAQAQGKAAYSNGTGCATFSTFSYDSSTNTLSLNCTTSTSTQPSTTFTWSSAGTTAAPNTTMTVNIVRPTGLVGEMYVYYDMYVSNISGWSVDGGSNATQWVLFGAADTTKTLTINTGSVAGTLKMVLSRTSGAGTVPTGTAAEFNLSVSSTTTGGGGGSTPPPTNPTPPPGCTTSATKNDVFTISSQKIVFQLKPNETGAVAFTPTAATSLMTLSTSETVNTPADADHEVTISNCPGDFTKGYPCGYQANYVGNSLQAVPNAAPWQCALTPGVTYYMNVRHVKLRPTSPSYQSYPPENSCVSGPQYLNGACEVRLQNTGL